MSENKNYYRLLKNIPMEKCPDDFTSKVIQKSGILANGKSSRSPEGHSGWSSCFYGFACIVTTILIVATINFGVRNFSAADPDRLATNTVTLARQLAEGMKVAFTGIAEIGSEVK